MKAVFADTFYWAALTSAGDSAHERALDLSRSLSPDKIVTTDEVLCEYLAFFASARPRLREDAGRTVAELIDHPDVHVIPKVANLFSPGFNCIGRGPTKAMA